MLKKKKHSHNELFDEFYAKFKDIVNSTFNLGETILEPKIIRKVLRSLPERFHAKITAIEESKDIDKILLTELVGNLQTYELGLTRIGKSSKSMALKAKSSDTDESSDDEDSKMKSYITRQFKNLSFNLEETIPEPKIVRKVLRSLLERFHAKITADRKSVV